MPGPAASGADIVLEQAQVFDTAEEAIADCSPGLRLDRPPPRPGHAGRRPGRDGRRESRASAGRSAILFGPERSGLETEDVALANAIVTVPINPEFGSLNLAQAVILLAYEWSQASAPGAAAGQGAEAARAAWRARGPDRAISNGELDAKGYFHPPREPRRPRTRCGRSSPRPAGHRGK